MSAQEPTDSAKTASGSSRSTRAATRCVEVVVAAAEAASAHLHRGQAGRSHEEGVDLELALVVGDDADPLALRDEEPAGARDGGGLARAQEASDEIHPHGKPSLGLVMTRPWS